MSQNWSYSIGEAKEIRLLHTYRFERSTDHDQISNPSIPLCRLENKTTASHQVLFEIRALNNILLFFTFRHQSIVV